MSEKKFVSITEKDVKYYRDGGSIIETDRLSEFVSELKRRSLEVRKEIPTYHLICGRDFAKGVTASMKDLEIWLDELAPLCYKKEEQEHNFQITFDKSSAKYMLNLFGYGVDEENYIVEKGTSNRVLVANDGGHIKLYEFGGLQKGKTKGSVIFIRNDIVSLLDLVEKDKR